VKLGFAAREVGGTLVIRTVRHGYAPYRACNSANDASSPASALAMTVGGLASQTLPGPDRPGKFRLMALIVT